MLLPSPLRLRPCTSNIMYLKNELFEAFFPKFSSNCNINDQICFSHTLISARSLRGVITLTFEAEVMYLKNELFEVFSPKFSSNCNNSDQICFSHTLISARSIRGVITLTFEAEVVPQISCTSKMNFLKHFFQSFQATSIIMIRYIFLIH